MLYRFNLKQCLILCIAVLGGYLFTVTQKYYIPEYLRPPALFTVIIAIFLGFFIYVDPGKPQQLATTLGLILGIATLLILIIQHVIISKDFAALIPKAVIIFIVAVVSPLISGMVYQYIKTSSASKSKTTYIER